MCVGVTTEELYSKFSFVGFLYAPSPTHTSETVVQQGQIILYSFLSKFAVRSHLSLPKSTYPIHYNKAKTAQIEPKMLQSQFPQLQFTFTCPPFITCKLP